MLNWQPDRQSKIPLKQQIIEFFEESISENHFKFNEKLPSERELATLFNVNRSTIKAALHVLKQDGLLISDGKKGTFISNNSWSMMASKSTARWNQFMKYSIHQPNQKFIQIINKEEFRDDIIRLGTGEISPDLFPNDIMAEILHTLSLNINALNYEEPLGYLPLREALCDYLKTIGIHVTPEEVLIVSGSLQGLSLISLSLLQPNSTVFVEAPSYLKSLNVFQSAGMKLKGVAMDDEGLDLEDLKVKYHASGTKMLYTIPTYHNPTTKVMSEKRRHELMTYIEMKQLCVVEDDAYRMLGFEETPLPMKAFDSYDHVIYMGSLSKSFSPGLRLGWIVGHASIIERLGDIKMQTDYGTSGLSQLVAYEWFRGGHYKVYQERLKTQLMHRCQLMMKVLDALFLDYATYEEPKGSFYIWLKFKHPMNIKALFDLALKEKILLNPGEIYDFKNNNALRLSYAYAKEEEMVNGLKVLDKLIRSMIEI